MKTITLEDPRIAGKANTEVGSLLIIDPCQLFTHEEWTKEVIKSPYDYESAIIMALGKKLGLDDAKIAYLCESACVAGTGGDATFSVVNGDKSGLPIVIGWPGADDIH